MLCRQASQVLQSVNDEMSAENLYPSVKRRLYRHLMTHQEGNGVAVGGGGAMGLAVGGQRGGSGNGL